MRPALRTVPSREPLREALASAQALVADREHALQDAEAALARGDAMVSETQARIAAATSEAEATKGRRAASLAAAARNGGATDSGETALGDARVRLMHAEAELEAARVAQAELADDRRRAEAELKRAREDAGRAADELLRTAGSRLLAEAQALQQQLVEKRLLLRWLVRERLLSGDDWHPTHQYLSRRTLPALESMTPDGDMMWDWQRADPSPRWRAAREALLRDPDAPLPE